MLLALALLSACTLLLVVLLRMLQTDSNLLGMKPSVVDVDVEVEEELDEEVGDEVVVEEVEEELAVVDEGIDKERKEEEEEKVQQENEIVEEGKEKNQKRSLRTWRWRKREEGS